MRAVDPQTSEISIKIWRSDEILITSSRTEIFFSAGDPVLTDYDSQTSIVNLKEDEYISTLSVGGSILENAPVIT